MENRIKEKKQSERRLHQKLNNTKQQKETVSNLLESDSKKRSRGAIQRARKRQKQDDCLTEKSVDQQQGSLQVETFSTRNPVAGRGRAEVISDENRFVDKHFHSDLPDIHSRVSTERTKVMKRARWFDES